MTILGGIGYFWGPPVEAAVLVWLNQITTDYTQYWSFVLGTILLVLLFSFPGGIVGGIVQLWQRLEAAAQCLRFPAFPNRSADFARSPTSA